MEKSTRQQLNPNKIHSYSKGAKICRNCEKYFNKLKLTQQNTSVIMPCIETVKLKWQLALFKNDDKDQMQCSEK